MKCEECPGRFMAFTEREDRSLPPKGIPEPALYCAYCGTKMVTCSTYWNGEYGNRNGKPKSYWVGVVCPFHENDYEKETGKNILGMARREWVYSKHQAAKAVYYDESPNKTNHFGYVQRIWMVD